MERKQPWNHEFLRSGNNTMPQFIVLASRTIHIELTNSMECICESISGRTVQLYLPSMPAKTSIEFLGTPQCSSLMMSAKRLKNAIEE